MIKRLYSWLSRNEKGHIALVLFVCLILIFTAIILITRHSKFKISAQTTTQGLSSSNIIPSGWEDKDGKFAGNGRKIAFMPNASGCTDTDPVTPDGCFYVFHSDNNGTTTNKINYKKCLASSGCNEDSDWSANVPVDSDTADTGDYNPNIYVKGDNIAVAWVDDITGPNDTVGDDRIEFRVLDTKTDTFNQKCTSSDQGTLDSTNFPYIAMGDNGDVVVGYSDTAGDAEADIWEIPANTCSFSTSIKSASGLPTGSTTMRPILLALGNKIHFIYDDAANEIRHSVRDVSTNSWDFIDKVADIGNVKNDEFTATTDGSNLWLYYSSSASNGVLQKCATPCTGTWTTLTSPFSTGLANVGFPNLTYISGSNILKACIIYGPSNTYQDVKCRETSAANISWGKEYYIFDHGSNLGQLSMPLSVTNDSQTGLAVSDLTNSRYIFSEAKTPVFPVPTTPNIVVIMTDDQTYASMSKMTKVNQILGCSGTTFNNALNTNNLCCPARATFLSGQYSHNNKVFSNKLPYGGYTVYDHFSALPVWLYNAGYTTAHIGKYLNNYGNTFQTEIPAGWSEWYTSVGGSAYTYYGYTLNENGTLKTYPDDGTGKNYSTDVYAGKAVNFITQHKNDVSPFFLWVDFFSPHGDGNDPNNYPVPALRHKGTFANEPLPQDLNFNEADVSDKPAFIQAIAPFTQADIDDITNRYRNRLESLLAGDEGVESIVNALAANNKLDNTYIVFLSDNGYYEGQHRLKKEKTYLYEEGIRMPLIIKGPGIPVQTIDKMVANVDLAPTILDFAKASGSRVMDGKSLVPLIADPTITIRNDVLIEGNDDQYRAVRNSQFKYSEYNTGEKEYYDLVNDPFEINSMTSYDPNLVTRLQNLKTCSGASCF